MKKSLQILFIVIFAVALVSFCDQYRADEPTTEEKLEQLTLQLNIQSEIINSHAKEIIYLRNAVKALQENPRWEYIDGVWHSIRERVVYLDATIKDTVIIMGEK